jgi:hypothetical protein
MSESKERDDRVDPRAGHDETELVREDGVLVHTGEALEDLEQTVQAHRRNRSRRVAG